MRRVFVGIVAAMMSLPCGACAADATPRDTVPSVRFLPDTVLQGVHLPAITQAWSSDGRRFIAEGVGGIRIVDAGEPGRSEYHPLLEGQRDFAWSPGDSVIACSVRFVLRSGWARGDAVFLLRPGCEPEKVAEMTDVGRIMWLPNGALVQMTRDGEYAVLRPGTAESGPDSCTRLWGVHFGEASGGESVGLMPVSCAPPSSRPLLEVNGWALVWLQSEAQWMRVWWATRFQQFVGWSSSVGLLRLNSFGEQLGVKPIQGPYEVVRSLAHGGELAIGIIPREPFSEAGPGFEPTFAWSIEAGWRAPIEGLPGGSDAASAAPVGDRILFQTRRGLELGRLVIER